MEKQQWRSNNEIEEIQIKSDCVMTESHLLIVINWARDRAECYRESVCTARRSTTNQSNSAPGFSQKTLNSFFGGKSHSL